MNTTRKVAQLIIAMALALAVATSGEAARPVFATKTGAYQAHTIN